MRFNRILLVNPSYLGRGGLRPSVTIGMLAEILEKGEIEYDVLDMPLGYGRRDLKKRIEAFRPDLIAFSMMTYYYLKNYQLITYVKEQFPSIPTIAGGAHISTFKEKALEECRALDFGWVYECEDNLLDFCRGKDFQEISGLIYREGDSIRYPKEGHFVKNLDDYPFPKYRRLEMDRYIREIDIVTSRGCPYGCVFCPAKNSSGRMMRYRSPENVLSEIRYWYEKGWRKFTIADDNFTLDKKRAGKILDLINQAGFKDAAFRAATGLRADQLDREILEKMKKAGFHHLSIGVESGSNKVLGLVKKGETIEQIERTLQTACDMGFDVILFFVVGLTGETFEDFLKSVEVAKKYPVFNVYFSNMTPYPYTEMYEWVQKNGTFVVDSRDYLNRSGRAADLKKPLFYTKEFSYEERVRALTLRVAVGRDVLKKALSRKLKRLGFLGRIIAYFGSFYFIYDTVINTGFMRKIAQRVVFRN
jgi:anaerobic magnesium-protoporphyrin IX monomethyl ester cyclase